jgi:hypothetical protein
MVNVTIYGIHGSYGLLNGFCCLDASGFADWKILFRHLRVFSAQFLASLVAIHDQFGIRVYARVMENSTLGVEVLDGALGLYGFVPFCFHEIGLENKRN